MSEDLQSQLQEILGPAYRIDRELGGGGMSRVFVATELELDRQVVVKVLPPDLAAGVNTDRFRREIQLAARLQHPHIVPLLAAGARASLLYYTMPFIAGENLRARLNRAGELPVQEATRLLREIVDALGYAHSQGVVHRDIKPENVLISGNHALVLDFGVSKALSNATSESSAPKSTLTSLGIALGTPSYMAPEQAAADPHVDHRADVYAFGVMAYELLTGSTPFAGLNQQQTLAAHITSAPRPITQHRPQVPPGLAEIIMRCLEKRPADRWQTATELHSALEPFAMTSSASAAVPVARKPFRWTPQRIAVAAGVVGLAATGLIVSTFAFKGDGDTLVVGNTRQLTSAPGLEIHPSLSPDGRLIAYTTRTSWGTQLFVRQISGGRAIPLTDSTLNPRWPRWSPDASEIFFTTGKGGWTVPALGGPPSFVDGFTSLEQCTWSNSGQQLACVNDETGLLSVIDRTGKNLRYLTDAGEGHSPAWSPDDKLIAFARGNPRFLGGPDIGNLAPSSLWVVRVEGGKPVQVSRGPHLNTAPIWTPEGALLFVSSRGGTRDIYLQRITGDLAPRGDPVRLTTGLSPHTISLSRDGSQLAYSHFTTVANVWTGTDSGSPTENVLAARPVTTGSQTIEQGFVSPDGKWLAYDSNLNGNQDIYKVPLPAGEPQQLTKNDADDFYPSWSPDGTEITFHSMRNGNRDIFLMDAGGSNVRTVFEGPGEQMAPAFRGGNVIFFLTQPDSVFETKRNGNGWSTPVFLFTADGGLFSPDGKWLVRATNPRNKCAGCVPGLNLSAADGSNVQPLHTPQIERALQQGGGFAWSDDSKHVYGQLREKDGTMAIWQIPINGDPERRVFHFTDPARQTYRGMFDINGKNFYFTIGDRQSDIWVMDLKKQ